MRRIILVLFFIGYALIGVSVVGDYPVPMDEPVQDLLGQETWKYVRGKEKEWTTVHDIRYQAPFVETIVHVATASLISPEIKIGPAYVMVRHLFLFLFYFSGVIVFYFLAKRITGNWLLALLGCSMLILTPRFFAHSFFNSKDLPNVALFIVAVWTLIRLLDRPTILRALVHGVAIGAAISTRPMGLFLVIMTLVAASIDALQSTNHTQRSRNILIVGLSLILGVLCTILFWPLLWTAPIQHFLEIMQWSRRAGGGFYFGVPTSSTAWHYLPVWITITTPLWILLPSVIGGMQSVYANVRKISKRQPVSRNETLLVLWVTLPWIALVVLRSGIFDEWRHVFFIYPGIVLFALLGIQMILKKLQNLREQTKVLSQIFLGAVFALCIASTTSWMIRNHPLEFAYFSVPSSWVKNNFELDYWALSSRLALRSIAERDERPVIKIAVTNTIIMVNAGIFFPHVKFVNVLPENADYIIDNFRNQNYQHTLPRDHLLEAITVDGIEIMHIYKGPLSFPKE